MIEYSMSVVFMVLVFYILRNLDYKILVETVMVQSDHPMRVLKIGTTIQKLDIPIDVGRKIGYLSRNIAGKTIRI